MRWLAVAVVVSGWAAAGFRNLPRMADPHAEVAGVAIALSCLACWWFGRRSGRAAAVAVAMARAEARAAAAAVSSASASNQLVLNIDTGARATAARELGGLERAEWIAGPVAELEQDAGEHDEAWELSGERVEHGSA